MTYTGVMDMIGVGRVPLTSSNGTVRCFIRVCDGFKLTVMEKFTVTDPSFKHKFTFPALCIDEEQQKLSNAELDVQDVL